MKVSIIVPVYNEVGSIQQSIADIRQEMNSLACEYEIIVVDEGSSDPTVEVLNDESVHILSTHKTEGMAPLWILQR